MRKLLMIMGALVLSTMAASAFEVNCGRPAILLGDDPRDNNPVVQIAVRYNPQEHAWRVFHQFANGGIISRSEQYGMVDASNEHRAQWRGILNRQRFIYMIGEVRREGDVISYHEWMYNQTLGNRMVMYSVARCQRAVSIPQPTSRLEEQPSQPYAQAPTNQTSTQPKTTALPVKDSVPIYPYNGMVKVDVIIGGQFVRMLLDTGASVNSVTDGLATKIVRDGQGTWGEKTKINLADGRIIESYSLLIKELRIGTHTIRNVRAVVSASSDMLLSFPTINSIAPFTIDTRNNELVFHTTRG